MRREYILLFGAILLLLKSAPASAENRPVPLLVEFSDLDGNSTIVIGEDRLYTLVSKASDLDSGADIALIVTALNCDGVWVNITNNGDAWGLLSGEELVQAYGLTSVNYGNNRTVYTRIKPLEGFPICNVTAYMKVYSASGGFSDWAYMGQVATSAKAGQTPVDETPTAEMQVNGTRPRVVDVRITGMTDGVIREGRRYTFEIFIVDPDGVAGVQQVESTISFTEDFNVTLHYYYGQWTIQEGARYCRILDQRSWIDREFKHIQLTLSFLELPVSERLVFQAKATDIDGLESELTTIEEEVKIIGEANPSQTQSEIDADSSRRFLGFILVVCLPAIVILFLFYSYSRSRRREGMDVIPAPQPFTVKYVLG